MTSQDRETGRQMDQGPDRNAGDPGDPGDATQRPHPDPLTGKMDTASEPRGADAGTGAGAGVSASGVESWSGGPDAERNEMGRGGRSDTGGGDAWVGGDPGLQADAGLVGRGGTGSLGSGGASTPQADPGETSWQDETAMTGGAQGQAGVEGESWQGRERDTGQGAWTQDDSGRTSGAGDDETGSSSTRTDLS